MNLMHFRLFICIIITFSHYRLFVLLSTRVDPQVADLYCTVACPKFLLVTYSNSV